MGTVLCEYIVEKDYLDPDCSSDSCNACKLGGIALDVPRDLMYFSDKGTVGSRPTRVFRAALDGTNPVVLLQEFDPSAPSTPQHAVSKIEAVAIDPSTETMYFSGIASDGSGKALVQRIALSALGGTLENYVNQVNSALETVVS